MAPVGHPIVMFSLLVTRLCAYEVLLWMNHHLTDIISLLSL